MDRKSGDIYVEDVYELAAEIGDEFQKMIDNLGSDSVKFLMPKVIRVLEHLEMLAILKEDFDSKMDSLKQNILQLENDKRERALSFNKYELEMESIEENWRKENFQLTEFVNQLRNQNLKLSNTLIDNEKSLSQSLTDLQKRGQIEIDSEILSLKESIRRSENKIESITKDIDSKDEEIEKLSSQLEEVMQQNRDLRRRVKQNKLFWSEVIVDPNFKDISGLLEQISDAVHDKTDGKNWFSLIEIRNLLLERNYLKSRLKESEKEINRLKSSNQSSIESHNEWTNQSKDEPKDDDLPVEGPINREPDDKLFPEKQNKILRFFPTLIWPRIKRP